MDTWLEMGKGRTRALLLQPWGGSYSSQRVQCLPGITKPGDVCVPPGWAGLCHLSGQICVTPGSTEGDNCAQVVPAKPCQSEILGG